jgi:hypothetical protein
VKDLQVTFGVSTLERWYYRTLGSDDPIKALGRKIRADVGTNKVVGIELLEALSKQYTSPNLTKESQVSL